jgi:hypothetical protein
MACRVMVCNPICLGSDWQNSEEGIKKRIKDRAARNLIFKRLVSKQKYMMEAAMNAQKS